MGNSAPRNRSVSAVIDCKSCLCSHSSEESCVKRERYTSDFEKSMETNPLDDLEISSSIDQQQELEHWIVEELNASESEVLHVCDNLGPLCVSNLVLDQEENCNYEENQPLLLPTDMLDGPNMHGIVLCSSVVQPYPLPLDAIEELSCGTVDKGKLSLEAPASACTLPVKKLISAFKGSREKQGKCLGTKLSVKWAPEVYDPPITSSLHTVKGRQRHHHHKTKKDYNVHKYTKGKPSRGSERKHAHRSSSGSLVDPRILRLQALRASNRQEPHSCVVSRLQALSASNRQEPNSCYQSKMEHPDYVVRRSLENIIRGSSCYMEPLAPITLPVAKAS